MQCKQLIFLCIIQTAGCSSNPRKMLDGSGLETAGSTSGIFACVLEMPFFVINRY